MLSQRSLGAAGKKDIPVDDEFNTVSALLHFDGTNNGVNNVFDDSSSSNHTITANGDVTQGSFGPFARPDGEWAVSFDGNDDRLSAPDSSDFDFGTGDFTIELFFNHKGSIANRWLIGGANHWQLRLKTASSPSRLGEVSFITNGSTEIIYVSSADLADSSWHHIAITREGTNLRHFLDGALVKTTTNSEAINADSALYIGASSTSSEDWDGHISNVRVVKGTAVYTSAFTTPAAPLTAVTNTKLLTCQSNRFVDNSASAHTITASGNAAVSAFGPFLTSEVYDAGVNGASAYFDGSGDYLTVPDSSEFTLGNTFTLEAWIYPTASNNYNSVQNQNGSSGYYWAHVSGEKMQFYRGIGGGIQHDSDVSSMVNQWTHVAYVCDAGTAYHYINGVRSGSSVSMSVSDISAVITLGIQGSSFPFPGYICDYRMVVGTAVYSGATYTIPTAPLTAVTNTKLLLNMADGQAIDSAAQHNLTLFANAKISNTQSKFGGTSMYFDGTGDEATYSSTGFGTGDFTMEAWVYPQTQPQSFPAVYFVTNGSSDRVAVAFDHDSQPNKFRCNVAGTVLSPSGTNAVDQWYHTAVVRYQGVITFYLNGTSVGSTAYTHNVGPETSFLGGNSPRSSELYFKGFLDDFRVSKTARYTSNFTPPTEPFADKGQ